MLEARLSSDHIEFLFFADGIIANLSDSIATLHMLAATLAGLHLLTSLSDPMEILLIYYLFRVPPKPELVLMLPSPDVPLLPSPLSSFLPNGDLAKGDCCRCPNIGGAVEYLCWSFLFPLPSIALTPASAIVEPTPIAAPRRMSRPISDHIELDEEAAAASPFAE